MFGIFRYILAAFVMLLHLYGEANSWSGIYAVFGFYMLSGYLITYIVVNVYGFSFKGLQKFFMNRCLRIYPTYIITLLFSIFAIFITKGYISEFNTSIKIPPTFGIWMKNIFIFGLQDENIKLVPPAWSLNVELVFYILIALVFARKRLFVSLWFIASLLYTAFIVYNRYDLDMRYFSFFAASLPFSTGSMIFYYKDKLKFLPKYGLIIVSLLYGVNVLFANHIWENPTFEGFYVSYFLTALVIIYLLNINVKLTPQWLQKVDKSLGNMSYPMFLGHWHVSAIILKYNFYIGKSILSYFITCFLLTNLFAMMINLLIDKKIDLYRDKIRPEPAPTGKQAATMI